MGNQSSSDEDDGYAYVRGRRGGNMFGPSPRLLRRAQIAEQATQKFATFKQFLLEYKFEPGEFSASVPLYGPGRRGGTLAGSPSLLLKQLKERIVQYGCSVRKNSGDYIVTINMEAKWKMLSSPNDGTSAVAAQKAMQEFAKPVLHVNMPGFKSVASLGVDAHPSTGTSKRKDIIRNDYVAVFDINMLKEKTMPIWRVGVVNTVTDYGIVVAAYRSSLSPTTSMIRLSHAEANVCVRKDARGSVRVARELLVMWKNDPRETHGGVWREGRQLWCSRAWPGAIDGDLCLHDGLIQKPHWSCCGADQVMRVCSCTPEAARKATEMVSLSTTVTSAKQRHEKLLAAVKRATEAFASCEELPAESLDELLAVANIPTTDVQLDIDRMWFALQSAIFYVCLKDAETCRTELLDTVGACILTLEACRKHPVAPGLGSKRLRLE